MGLDLQYLFYLDVLFTTYFFSTDICYTKIIIKPQKYYLNIHLSLALKIYEIFFVDIKMFFSPNWWQYLYVKNENIAAAMLDNIVNPTITSTVGILFCIFQWTRWYPALNCKNIFFINFIYIYIFSLLFCASFVTKLLWRKKKEKYVYSQIAVANWVDWGRARLRVHIFTDEVPTILSVSRRLKLHIARHIKRGFIFRNRTTLTTHSTKL